MSPCLALNVRVRDIGQTAFHFRNFCRFMKIQGLIYPSRDEAAREFRSFCRVQEAIISDFVFHKFFPGKLFIILGTSTSGKTSFSKALTSSVISDKGVLYIGTDYFYQSILVKKVLSLCPQKSICYRYLKSIDNEIIERYTLFPATIEPSIAEFSHIEIFFRHANEVINERLFNSNSMNCLEEENYKNALFCSEVFPYLKSGGIVVADVVSLTEILPYMVQNLVHCEKCIVFLYCSPLTLRNRIIFRNKKAIEMGDYADVRFSFPYFQFLENYRSVISDESSDSSITKDQMSSLDIPIPELPACTPCEVKEWLIKYYENLKVSEKKSKDKLLTSWFGNCSSATYVKLVPFQRSDIILDTGKSQISACIEQVASLFCIPLQISEK